MDGLPASQIFVNCPGKANTPWAGACNNSIPFAILCTTTGNAGKWYRKCTQCGYYEWVEPSATGPSDSCPTTVPPYATQPPRQYPSPPPSQAVSGGASFQQFDSTTSSQYASQQPAPQAIASAAQSGICANVGCTRRWTATTCSKRMCKACCIAGAGGCTCKSHAKPRVFSTSSNPFHLSRPLPTIPYDTPQASIPLATESSTEGVATAATSASPSLPGPSSFEFSKPADESFLREFKRLQEQRARRNAQDKTLMAYKARIKHAVVIVAFLTPDLESPVTVPVQGIATWPTFNLVDVPDILSLLSVSSLDELNLFDPKLGIWLTRVDHVMEVTQNQAIYVRHDGVKTSLGDLDSSNPLLSSLLSSQAPSATRKRIMHESPYPMTPAKSPT
ncbi:hypothetical protein DFP72DRAFT_1053537 [Ephemerocybe angulata]|uniref:Uncharacterized protein n=1 Tax=Ephemerocybe angulata TaxID=980116 RepID=A0A8H6HB87_9AGAR|nr:hypothetical protein DFP72DRAFT_1053537 [Tulosesus angulatus]